MSDKINGPSAYLSALSEAPREDLLSEVCRQKIRAETAESRVKELEAKLEQVREWAMAVPGVPPRDMTKYGDYMARAEVRAILAATEEDDGK